MLRVLALILLLSSVRVSALPLPIYISHGSAPSRRVAAPRVSSVRVHGGLVPLDLDASNYTPLGPRATGMPNTTVGARDDLGELDGTVPDDVYGTGFDTDSDLEADTDDNSAETDTVSSDNPNGSGNATVGVGGTYQLADMYQGEDFYQWNFFNAEDPTKGMVNFLDLQAARDQKLALVDDDGAFWMTVDDQTALDANMKRNSVRISSPKTYNDGLVVADILNMPYGCSVWPAWWTVGGDWPNKGEIDVLEGVHNQMANQYTYHTGPGCSLDDTQKKMTANILSTQCTVVPGQSNAGCGMTDSSSYPSYGEGFNANGGGVFAHLRDANGISIWFFPRDSIPDDITAKTPDPSTWPTPASFLANNDKCDVPNSFVDHVLTFDITLCGDWAGDQKGFEAAGCSGTCADLVMDPTNYQNAKWKVSYVATYLSSG